MEFPIQFFMDYAWDPEAFPADRLADYTRRWAEDIMETEMLVLVR